MLFCSPSAPHEVGLPRAALGEDVPDGRGVVLGVDPVADVLAPAVELRALAVDDVGDLAGDELLHVLVGTVVVRAVGDGRAQPVGACPGADEHVARGFGGAVRGAGLVRSALGELRRIVEGQVTVDLVGRDVVVADTVLANRLEQAKRALDVGAQERLRVGDGVVVVALGGVVHDGVVAGNDSLQKLGVADVAHDELDAVGGKARDVGGVARVGELVEHGHVHVRVVVHHVVHEVAADEAAAARDDDIAGMKGLSHLLLQPTVRINYEFETDFTRTIQESACIRLAPPMSLTTAPHLPITLSVTKVFVEF